MANPGRPLSPHLQVYRWQLTMVLSITHRATGVFLSVAAIGLAAWLLAAAAGPGPYDAVTAAFASLPGRAVLVAVTFSFFYHLCNGIRHLVWDSGRWLEIPEVYASGWSVVVVSVLLTVLTWAVVLARVGTPS
jgi:succinate dehydrogenase / fumarate reductase cytochrome b subunit